ERAAGQPEENLDLVEEASADKLRVRSVVRQELPLQILVGRSQHQVVGVGDGDLVDQRVFLGGDELSSQAFADLERVPDIIVDFFRSIGIRAQAELRSFYQRMLGLKKDLLGQL